MTANKEKAHYSVVSYFCGCGGLDLGFRGGNLERLFQERPAIVTPHKNYNDLRGIINRRDEMWVTERDKKGESTLRGVSEYVGVRYDKNLLKSYLDGAFGGVPSIRINKRKDNKEDAHA